jgi:hypothetical protein
VNSFLAKDFKAITEPLSLVESLQFLDAVDLIGRGERLK